MIIQFIKVFLIIIYLLLSIKFCHCFFNFKYFLSFLIFSNFNCFQFIFNYLNNFRFFFFFFSLLFHYYLFNFSFCLLLHLFNFYFI